MPGLTTRPTLRAHGSGGTVPGATPVTSIYDGSSSSAFLTGLMWGSIPQECPQAQYTGIALEFGTVPLLETLQALRAEQWLQLHPDAPQALAASIKQQLKDAFHTETDGVARHRCCARRAKRCFRPWPA